MKKYIPYTSLNISLNISTTKKKKTNTIILKIISKLFTLQKKIQSFQRNDQLNHTFHKIII